MGTYDAMMKQVHDKANNVNRAEDEECPVCGYYCLGKGGIGCIDKPGLVHCYAQQVTKTKRRVGWFHWSVLFVGICMIVYGMNSDAVVQEVPVVDAAAIQRLQKENELLARKVADYKALSANLAGRLKEANGRLAKLEEERNVLAHSSVPSQPVILEAVRKEVSTPAGFRQVVARNFGAEIAKRIQVRE